MERVRSPDASPSQSPPTKRRTTNGDVRRSLAADLGVTRSVRSPVAYSDRFVPTRSAGDLAAGFHVQRDALAREKAPPPTPKADRINEENQAVRHTYDAVLRCEMFGADVSDMRNSPAALPVDPSSPMSTPTKRNLLQFSADPRSPNAHMSSPFALSPLGETAKSLLVSPQKTPRKISKTPFKVLEAPSIQDDFYLNLIDWGPQNVLAVGLGSSVYLWHAQTSQVTKLSEFPHSDLVTSVSWMGRGGHIALGSNSGQCVVWDAAVGKEVRVMGAHKNRVGTLCWNGNILTSGSRDRFIYHHDMRSPKPYVAKLAGHKQEICGLRWSPDGSFLASGGNDNRLLIWSAQSSVPVQKHTDHTAAVKAIAWSPHQRGLMCSGGGTADRSIRFRNILTNTALHALDSGSQVCNLSWSKNINEIVSTHGYSQNQIVVWSYPQMQPLARLTGHMMRVLYLAVSPDGQTIVTGAGDETLRFWNVFPSATSKEASRSSMLSIPGNVIR